MDIRRRKILKIAVATAAVAPLVLLGHIMRNSNRSDRLNEGYAQVEIGDGEDKVLLVMGTPDRVVLPGAPHWWSWKTQGCVKQYQYDIRILPELWVIGFDARGKVAFRGHNVM